MDQNTKEQLEKGFIIHLNDFEVKLFWDGHNNRRIMAYIYRRNKDDFNNHLDFREEDIDQLIEDLKDLSDWRHYRRLMNKLNKE